MVIILIISLFSFMCCLISFFCVKKTARIHEKLQIMLLDQITINNDMRKELDLIKAEKRTNKKLTNKV